MTALAEPTTTTTSDDEAASVEVVVELMKALGHPIRVGILRELTRGKGSEKSPGEMATTLGHPLGVVSYHVRMLRDYGAVEMVRTEPRRGALQHFYAARAEVREMLKAFDRVAKVTGKAQRERAEQGQ